MSRMPAWLNGARARRQWSRRAWPRQARRGASGGQALVEFALMVTVVVLLLAGATDEASLLNDHLNVVYAARQGARTAAVLGQAADADCAAIGAVQAALAGDTNLTLNQIIIYKANSSGQPISTSYEDIYTGSSTCTVTNGIAAISPSGQTQNWPPADRSDTPFYEDSVGVQLQFTYQFTFQLLGSGGLTGTDQAVYPIEISATVPQGS